jgi:hypothetical protein
MDGLAADGTTVSRPRLWHETRAKATRHNVG